MGFSVAWEDIDKHVIRIDAVQDDITWSDVFAAVDVSYDMMGEVSHTVHTIIAMRSPKQVLTGALHRSRQMVANVHPNQGMSIFVGGGMLMETMIGISRRLMPSLPVMHCVATVEEARALIAAQEREQV
ncbi:MAG: hypothetical protein JW910_10875 [Anaerolineae bacterium]|nr:hypothetical protein [Anaerolineae bacterium]